MVSLALALRPRLAPAAVLAAALLELLELLLLLLLLELELLLPPLPPLCTLPVAMLLLLLLLAPPPLPPPPPPAPAPATGTSARPARSCSTVRMGGTSLSLVAWRSVLESVRATSATMCVTLALQLSTTLPPRSLMAVMSSLGTGLQLVKMNTAP